MREGERQVAPDISGIRQDHVERYRWAAKTLKKLGAHTVIDISCGVGYGSKILADAGFSVTAIDVDDSALAYARQHYAHERINYLKADAENLGPISAADAVVSFETIEHLRQPQRMFDSLKCTHLLVSVPNEEVFPWRGYKYHYRHYTKQEFAALLRQCGFVATAWWGQEGKESKVVRGVKGRTLVALAKKSKTSPKKASRKEVDLPFLPPPDAPRTVVILGLGPTLKDYIGLTTRMGAKRKMADEVWGINAVLDIVQCDRGFHMDDVRVQQIRADKNPTGNIAAMMPWLKKHPGPIYTSQAHPDYPGLVPYPLEDVLNKLKNQRYFNSTAAYAVAYAIFLGVKKIILFGFDFSYEHSHHAEKGRGCVEFWVGFAMARGIEIAVPKRSSLLDACEPPERRFYGYDCLKIEIPKAPEGMERVIFTPKDPPTAEEIEDRYDHSKSTVPEHLRSRAPA